MQQQFSALQKITRELNQGGITWGVGGSLLLYINGLSDTFEDIDLIVQDKDALAAQRLLIKHGPMQPRNPDERFRTRGFFEFIIDEAEIDLMSVLAIMLDGEETIIPFDESSIQRHEPFGIETLPLMYLEDWYVIYALIERTGKLDLLEAHFKEKGVNADRMKFLLDVSLPKKILERLEQWV